VQKGRWLSILAVLLVTEFVYCFIVSAGLFRNWPSYLFYCDELAEGFRSGHLYIPTRPSPELLAKPDPYDPANMPLWLWDASLHEGRYYLYWGPVPALLQALVKTVLRINKPLGDQYLVFVLVSLSTLFSALLVERVARRIFVGIPSGLIAVAIVPLAFANPVIHLLATGVIYQAAIAGGQAFLLAGLIFAFDAVYKSDQAPAGGWRLLAAGACWGLALASRISTALPTAIFIVATSLALGWTAHRRWRRIAVLGLTLAAPVVLTGCALLLYNKLRFDQWLEFGANNQLSTMKWRTSSDYFVPNIYSYLLRPYESSCQFPYVRQVWNMGQNAFPAWMRAPDGYWVSEPTVGWLRVVPIAWLLVVAVAAMRRPALLGRVVAAPTEDDAAKRRLAYRFCFSAFAAMAVLGGLMVSELYMATMRFLGDVVYGLVLLGILGGFSLYALCRKRLARIAVAVSFSALCLVTAGYGLLLGYPGYHGHFLRFNPTLDAKLVQKLSVCGEKKP
jgi:hypothetical protein